MTCGPWRAREPPAAWPAGWRRVGATLSSGFDLVADRIELAERIERADLVITGEGLLDEESFHGKAVGGVVGAGRRGRGAGGDPGRRRRR